MTADGCSRHRCYRLDIGPKSFQVTLVSEQRFVGPLLHFGDLAEPLPVQRSFHKSQNSVDMLQAIHVEGRLILGIEGS